LHFQLFLQVFILHSEEPIADLNKAVYEQRKQNWSAGEDLLRRIFRHFTWCSETVYVHV